MWNCINREIANANCKMKLSIVKWNIAMWNVNVANCKECNPPRVCLCDVLNCFLILFTNFNRGLSLLSFEPGVLLPQSNHLLFKNELLVRPKQRKLVRLWLPDQPPAILGAYSRDVLYAKRPSPAYYPQPAFPNARFDLNSK